MVAGGIAIAMCLVMWTLFLSSLAQYNAFGPGGRTLVSFAALINAMAWTLTYAT